MPQTTQIIPKWTFPHVETYINDYTFVTDDVVEEVADTSVKEAFAFISGKGIDNTWIKKSSRESSVKTFGKSNFNLYGQPLMQALEVVSHDDTSVWMMRVMPENATYANGIVSAYYKADAKQDDEDILKRKFRIKLTAKNAENIITVEDLEKASSKLDGVPKSDSTVYVDDEGFTQAEIMAVRASGRGSYGNDYYIRITKESSYEKEFGIKLYKFEINNNEIGLTTEATYVGANVTSAKYYSEGITLINDVLDETEKGLAPVDIRVNEDNVEVVYNAYIKFAKEWHKDLIAYLPSVQDDAEKKAKVEELIESTEDENLPDLDEFDILFGINPNSTTEHPGIFFVKTLTDNVDVSADEYVAADYTNSEVIDFSSSNGLHILGGSNGYFDNPRTVGELKWTKEMEIEECYKKAFDGSYDKRILSKTRMAINAIFDANYPYSVKMTIADLIALRGDCRAYLDVGIINTISLATVRTLANQYSILDNRDISVDIHNYKITDPDTGKKCIVTISYFNSCNYADHINAGRFYIPMVKGNCQLEGHVRDSLLPCIDDYENELKQALYDARLNYYEPITDNVFQRAVQNTTQMSESDCLEENNVAVLHALVRNIEFDANDEIYNFADKEIRSTFVETELAKYSDWKGLYLDTWDLTFATSAYESKHQILHLYVSCTFRGLNKAVIAEVDLNKRSQSE